MIPFVFLLSWLSLRNVTFWFSFSFEEHVVLELTCSWYSSWEMRRAPHLDRGTSRSFSECQIGKGRHGPPVALFFRMVNKVLFFSKNASKNRKTLKWIGIGVEWLDLWYLNYPGHIYEFFTGQIIIPSFHPLPSFSFILFFSIWFITE